MQPFVTTWQPIPHALLSARLLQHRRLPGHVMAAKHANNTAFNTVNAVDQAIKT